MKDEKNQQHIKSFDSASDNLLLLGSCGMAMVKEITPKDPIIRVDLVFILPFLLVFILIS